MRETSRQGPLWSGFAPVVAFRLRNCLEIVSNEIASALVLVIWWVEGQIAPRVTFFFTVDSQNFSNLMQKKCNLLPTGAPNITASMPALLSGPDSRGNQAGAVDVASIGRILKDQLR